MRRIGPNLIVNAVDMFGEDPWEATTFTVAVHDLS